MGNKEGPGAGGYRAADEKIDAPNDRESGRSAVAMDYRKGSPYWSTSLLPPGADLLGKTTGIFS